MLPALDQLRAAGIPAELFNTQVQVWQRPATRCGRAKAIHLRPACAGAGAHVRTLSLAEVGDAAICGSCLNVGCWPDELLVADRSAEVFLAVCKHLVTFLDMISGPAKTAALAWHREAVRAKLDLICRWLGENTTTSCWPLLLADLHRRADQFDAAALAAISAIDARSWEHDACRYLRRPPAETRRRRVLAVHRQLDPGFAVLGPMNLIRGDERRLPAFAFVPELVARAIDAHDPRYPWLADLGPADDRDDDTTLRIAAQLTSIRFGPSSALRTARDLQHR